MAKVSYSQYTIWANCPHQYKLNYIDKLGTSTSNINTIFGTSMHEVPQHYLTVFYGVSKKQANMLDLKGMLLESMRENFKKEQDKMPEGQLIATKEEMEEFYLDGIEIPVINHFSTQGSAGGPQGILNVSFIDEVKLTTSAFDAKYDNALSSVFDFKQKRAGYSNYGNPSRLNITRSYKNSIDCS